MPHALPWNRSRISVDARLHTSVMLSDVDVISFRKLGVELTCEAKKEQKKNYQKV